MIFKSGAKPGQGLLRMTVKRAIRDVFLIYRLTEEPAADESVYYKTAYSLTVTKIDCGGTRREIKKLYDVSRSRCEAERIFELVSRGRVTPCTLSEVVEDLLCV